VSGRPAGALVMALAAGIGPAIAADFKINPTSMEPGEVSLEDNSSVIAERGRSTDSAQAHFLELGYGVTEYWWTEVEGHRESGEGGIKFRTVDFENGIRLAPQSGYWPETALFLEYDAAVDGRSPEGATVGGLFQEHLGPSLTLVNLLFDREFGRNAASGTRLRYTGSSTWQLAPEAARGIRFFGAPGRVGNFDRLGGQDQRIGPVFTGGVETEGAGEFGYEVAYLFGLTPASPRGTVVWRLEYSRRF